MTMIRIVTARMMHLKMTTTSPRGFYGPVVINLGMVRVASRRSIRRL